MLKRNHIAFIGLGLIGGSLAGCIRKSFPSIRISAYTRTRATLVEAMDKGIIDEILEGPTDARIASCDMIILCAPVETNIRSLETMAGAGLISPGCLVTDVGSVKMGIHRAARRLHLTDRFIGGHPMAAGLSLPEENVAVFREKINALCTLTEEDMKKKVLLDAAVPISAFDEKSVEELQLFAPCGPENPAPLFGDRNNKVVRMRRIGKNNNFLKMTMEDSKGVRYSAVCFKDADEVILALSEKYGTAQVDRAFEGRDNDIRLTISYVPEINEYNGIRSIQMKIQGILY